MWVETKKILIDVVGVDPGLNDLVYRVDADDKKASEFRRSQDQRREETKKRKRSKAQLELKREQINGKATIEWKAELSKLNRKSLFVAKLKERIQKKRRDAKRSEQKMIR